MKTLCPRCKQPIDLHYLEKKGDQMARCARCNTIVAATYKKDTDRLYWEVYYEKALPVLQKEPRGCGWILLIAIVIFILFVVSLGILNDPYEQPDETPAGQFQN